MYSKYFIREIPKTETETRTTETPYGVLRRIHERTLELFARVQVPDYVHSGVKGRSYVTNAKPHVGEFETYKVDIKSFFPNTKWLHIYHFFLQQLRCSSDISAIMANLLTVNGHLPTGSPISTLMSYFIHSSLFDRLHDMARQSNVIMTLYVDDLSFSGEKITGDLKHQIQRGIVRADLRFHKEKHYRRYTGREVTGTIATDRGLRLPNRKHKAAYEASIALLASTDEADAESLYRSLLSRWAQGAQVDPNLRYRMVALHGAKPNILPKITIKTK